MHMYFKQKCTHVTAYETTATKKLLSYELLIVLAKKYSTQNHYNRYGSYATVQFQGWISAIQSFVFLFNFNMWYEKILN